MQLLRFTGQDTDSPEETAPRQVVAQVAAASRCSHRQIVRPLEAMIADMGPHDASLPLLFIGFAMIVCSHCLKQPGISCSATCAGMHFQ